MDGVGKCNEPFKEMIKAIVRFRMSNLESFQENRDNKNGLRVVRELL